MTDDLRAEALALCEAVEKWATSWPRAERDRSEWALWRLPELRRVVDRWTLLHTGTATLPPFDDMGPTDEMSSKLQAATECAEAAAHYVMSERFISDELALKAAVEKWQKS